MNLPCGANGWTAAVAVLWFLHSVFEYWVGKTSKFKSASTWELLITGIVSIAVLTLRRKENGKTPNQ